MNESATVAVWTVEAVALWTGLIASIVGIVLSGVAIWFSLLVNRRSDEISSKTIQALQKIESAVEQQSDDTRELIKAAWDKLLGNMDRSSSLNADVSAKEIAAGISSELRAELGALAAQPQGTGRSATDVARVEELLKQVETTLEAQLRSRPSMDRPSEALPQMIDQLTRLSPEARVLLAEVRGGHISLDEYRKLRKGRLDQAMDELREAGLLVPVQHRRADGPPVPCYYYPPRMAKTIWAALPLLPTPSPEVGAMVKAELQASGYESASAHQ